MKLHLHRSSLMNLKTMLGEKLEKAGIIPDASLSFQRALAEAIVRSGKSVKKVSQQSGVRREHVDDIIRKGTPVKPGALAGLVRVFPELGMFQKDTFPQKSPRSAPLQESKTEPEVYVKPISKDAEIAAAFAPLPISRPWKPAPEPVPPPPRLPKREVPFMAPIPVATTSMVLEGTLFETETNILDEPDPESIQQSDQVQIPASPELNMDFDQEDSENEQTRTEEYPWSDQEIEITDQALEVVRKLSQPGEYTFMDLFGDRLEWQRRFIRRLIEANLVTKLGDNRATRYSSTPGITDILSNRVDVAVYLWPHRQFDVVMLSPSTSPAPITAPGVSSPPETESIIDAVFQGLGTMRTQVVEMLTGQTEVMIAHKEQMDRIERKLDFFIRSLGEDPEKLK